MTKLKEDEINEEELKEVFDGIDEDGSGELDIDEFAKAIKASIVTEEEDEDDN